MVFVTKLLRTSSGYDIMWVIVDRLTMSTHFLPMPKYYKMDRLARLYLNEIIARNGMPISIISDHDICFTSRFGQTMKEALGTRLDIKKLLPIRGWKPLEFQSRFRSLSCITDEELNGVHDTFHVSNLKKCLADPTLKIPLDEIRVDSKLNFVEEPMEILEREFKKLKRRIAIVKIEAPYMHKAHKMHRALGFRALSLRRLRK
ncbi:reverse transcriptase domain-containing protein, partial [Tanacetum coccineum]